MEIGIALGSNLGNRLENLIAARDALRAFGEITASAPVYSTEPVDCPEDAADFFNTVVALETDWLPIALLNETQKIELTLGRAPVRKVNAPRPVDLDLLYAEYLTSNTERLTLPHPRLKERRFVLEPLAKIRPDLLLPGEIHPVDALLSELVSDEPPLKLEMKEW